MREQLGGGKRSVSSVSAASTPTKVTGEKRKNPKPKKRALTVLDKTRRDMTEKELAKGFLDENGEDVWILKEIMAYDPERGYKVKWMGWPEPTCMSWLCIFLFLFKISGNLPQDMPRNNTWANARMARVRYSYFRDTQ